MKYLSPISFLLFLFVIYSCEYQLNEKNFAEIDNTPDDHVFELNFSSNQDTIEVFDNIEFTYDLNTYGLYIYNGEFTIDTTNWKIDSEEGSFIVSPYDFEPGYHTLKLSLITNSGTGSVADLSGYEEYLYEKEWTLLIDSRDAPSLNIYKTITPEGYLKLYWDTCNQFNFDYYEFYKGYNLQKTIFDKDSTFFIDSTYIGMSSSFRVATYIKRDINNQEWGASINIDDHFPIIKIEEKGVDSLRFYWKSSPYNAKFTLTTSNDTFGSGFIYDTTLTIANPGFGDYEIYTLSTYPIKLNEFDWNYVAKSDTFYFLGRRFHGSWFYAYNQVSKLIYTSYYRSLECYNISDLSFENSVLIDYTYYWDVYACNTISDKVAVVSYNSNTSNEEINVYFDHTFWSKTTLPFDIGSTFVDIDHFYLTDNDIVAVACASKYELIDISTQSLLGTLNIDDYPDNNKWASFSTSKDGKYMCYVTMNGLYLYNIENGIFTLLHTDNRSYNSVLFDKNNPEILYLTFNGTNVLETRNVNSFTLVSTLNLETQSQVLRNIDPETGYMLLADYQNIYLIDHSSSEILFKIKSPDLAPKIFDNRLFSQSGYTINITDYTAK